MEITQIISRPKAFIATDIASALQDIADIEEDCRIDREEQEAACRETEEAEYREYLADLEYEVAMERIVYDRYGSSEEYWNDPYELWRGDAYDY